LQSKLKYETGNQNRMDVCINKKIHGYEDKGDTECAYPYPCRDMQNKTTGDAQGHYTTCFTTKCYLL
jgi:hypothetical protein